MTEYRNRVTTEAMLRAISRIVGTHWAEDPDERGTMCEFQNAVTPEMLPDIAAQIARQAIDCEPYDVCDRVGELYGLTEDQADELVNIVDYCLSRVLDELKRAARREPYGLSVCFCSGKWHLVKGAYDSVASTVFMGDLVASFNTYAEAMQTKNICDLAYNADPAKKELEKR